MERKPFWMTRYDHLSLLNIPRSMRLFGPMINLWEGSNQGEGCLRFAKPKLTNIYYKNWQQNAHADMLIEMSFDEVIENHVNITLWQVCALIFRIIQTAEWIGEKIMCEI